MDTPALYEQLAEHLDQGVVASPKSPALMGILEVLFPPEEAEIAVRLPLMGTPLSELQELFPERAETLGDTLERMAWRGTVYASQKPSEERKYRLLPAVAGWVETPFWAGRDEEAMAKLAPLLLQYREEAFGAELARGEMPVMRVLPVGKSIKDTRGVLPFDDLEPRIEAASFRAVSRCPCRQIKHTVGEGCDHSLSNCFHFGGMGRYLVEYGMAREVSAEESLRILHEAHEEGLVHIVDNVEGSLSTICNCCGCCCTFLQAKKSLGLYAICASGVACAPRAAPTRQSSSSFAAK
jgi:hypothetical protein